MTESFPSPQPETPSLLDLITRLRDDQRKCWKGGDRVLAEEYRRILPALRVNREAFLDLVFSEFLLRKELGEKPTLEEYVRRFPEFERDLRMQVEVEEAFGSGPLVPVPEGVGPETTPQLTGADDSSAETVVAAIVPRIAGFEILGEVGRGGMGVVYKARQQRPDRIVALKMLLQGEHANEQALTRFQAEAEAVARSQHPNVVQLFEAGQHDGLHFFTLEFVPGGSLADKLRQQPLSAVDAARLVQGVACGVQHAHEHGVIHRDLKPANVLLSAEGTPRVTDFGLARRVETEGLTVSGDVVGTPSYMAPEQAAGDSRKVGPACDVYALGAVLYECLTGRPPFRAATTLETVLQVLNQEPAALRSLQAGVPRDLETICHKCLRKEPQRRYGSAAELADDLGRFLRGEPIRARPVGSGERLVKWVKRRPAIAGLLAAVVVVAVQGAALVTWALQPPDRKPAPDLLSERRYDDHNIKGLHQWHGKAHDSPNATFNTTPKAVVPFRGIEFLPRSVAIHPSPSAGVAASWRSPVAGKVKVKGSVADAGPTCGDGIEWKLLHRTASGAREVAAGAIDNGGKQPFGDGLRELDVKAGDTLLLVVLPKQSVDCDSTLVELEVREPGGKVWELADVLDDPLAGNPHADRYGNRDVWGFHDPRDEVLFVRALESHNGPVHMAAFSPTDDTLAAASKDGNVRLWDWKTGKLLKTLKGHSGEVDTVAYCPDGKTLATTSRDRTVILWDTATGAITATLKEHTKDASAALFSPDGKTLVTASHDTQILVRDPTGKVRMPLLGHKQPVTALAFAPDGKTLVSSSGNWAVPAQGGEVRFWDLETGRARGPAAGAFRGIWGVAFSPDGKTLAGGCQDGTVRNLGPATGKELSVFKGHTDRVISVAYSASGQRLASSSHDGTVRLWDPATGIATAVLRDHYGAVDRLGFSRDGKFLATPGVADGAVRIWELGK